MKITYASKVETKYINAEEICQRELAEYSRKNCRQDGIYAATVWMEKINVAGTDPIIIFEARWESNVSWHTSHKWCMFDQPSHS